MTMKRSIEELDYYLVGGAVRDLLQGVPCKDKDYVVVGSSVKEMLHLGFKPVGVDFPVFLHPETGDEWALARTEKKTGKGYKGFECVADSSVTLEEDLRRRDLTINSIAVDKKGNLVDPWGGRIHLYNKTLRHTSEAFSDDPVRVLRLFRLYARYGDGWTVDEDTFTLCCKLVASEDWKHLTAERAWKETEKALSEKHTYLYFDNIANLCHDTVWFKEFSNMITTPQPLEHHPEGNVRNHTNLCLQQAQKLSCTPIEKFAVLCHDLGKPVVYEKYGKLHGHEQAGIEPINSFCDRLKVPSKYRELATKVCLWHTLCHQALELTPKRIVKLLLDLDAFRRPDQLDSFLLCCEVDARGRGEPFPTRKYSQPGYIKACYKACCDIDCGEIASQVSDKSMDQAASLGERIKQEIHRQRINKIKQVDKESYK